MDSRLVYQYVCKLCGRLQESLGPVPDQLCDGCWELKVRVEAQPVLAKKLLSIMEEGGG